MSDICETVRIKSDNPEHEGGFVIINKSDFDPAEHELFDKPKKGAKKQEGDGAE